MEQKIDKVAEQYGNDAFVKAFSNREWPWNEVRDMFIETFKAGAAYALSSQWRSVEEELPPYDTDVLGAQNGSVYMCQRWAMCDGDDEYIICDAGSFHPTHWMPIPALPQERKGNEASRKI